ncbi:creatininase family protein [Rhodospirillum rubrum]|uniref:Creatininase n=1 Tax=Rhodospirillum rubrum (strain ATCC 11170 / ATH 1.1.1 / DSM 467 / LMG 4362 / NCIMB 8255 / S1) TaxID=269796 RepID=Q2RMX2_RHORT|nr:creatininase family protein [Rhodospirillum rubrum]ABC24523.1 Creatininase [Rhodospirillum rubrum ATCC 11170]AEO50275.1 creatininase [Rhodospirillum rubrum F11]MBK1663476.1 creatininase [Rhodospirillum rubrum]MBK1675674.1 creatininase [Rhodospirillum rubrum]MBK5956248.1 creatininase [Rhodospirillum rubrum]
MEKTVQLEHMNTRVFVEGAYDTALIPLGSCESHGDHLPFAMDALTAHKLALGVAERMEKVFVLPPTFFGFSQHYWHKPMSISLSQDTNIRVIADILDSLAHWKIRNVLIINGHDGNISAIDVAARAARLRHPDMKIGSLDAWWVTAGNLLPKDTFEVWNGLGHGGEGETSIGLACFPELVDMAHARGMIPEVDENVKELWDFSELTDYGATGAPEKATREKGQAMYDVLVDYLVAYLTKRRDTNWAYNPK